MLSVNSLIDKIGNGRMFEVYSITSDESMSEGMTLSKALAEQDAIAASNGTGNGLDVRLVIT